MLLIVMMTTVLLKVVIFSFHFCVGLGLGLLRGKVQFKAVCDGLRQHLVRFILQGDEIQLDRGPWCFWHIFFEGTGSYGSNTVLVFSGFPFVIQDCPRIRFFKNCME